MTAPESLRLGTATLDIRSYAIQGNAILGIKESGKSYAASKMAELLMDLGIPIIAFDPIGIWRFLRVAGAGKGYPVVVAGGTHGDLPLTPKGAPEIVRAAMREGVSLVIDLFDIRLSKADWRRVVEASVRALLYENAPYGLRHVFIEEAAEFVPQRILPGQGEVYAEVEKLVRMGGNVRLGCTLVSPRAEGVNKEVLELCDALFLFRQKGRRSIENLGKWLDVSGAVGSKQIVPSLATLPQGECWAWLAGSDTPVRARFPEKRTLHPDRRLRRDELDVPAHRVVDVGAFVQHMSGTLEQIMKEAQANDPAKLKTKIAELERALSAKGTVNPAAKVDLDAAYAAGVEAGRSLGLREAGEILLGQQRTLVDEARPLFAQLRQVAAEAERIISKPLDIERVPAAPSAPSRSARATPPAPVGRQVSPPAVSNGTSATMGGGERKLLTVLAQYPEGRSKRQLAILAGYAHNGGAFNNYLGALRSKGRMEGQGDGPLRITDAGFDVLGSYEPLPTGRALLQYWLGQLEKAPRLILETVAGAYPRSRTKEETAAACGYEASGGGFNNALGKLRTLGLIGGRSELRASDELFGLGLADGARTNGPDDRAPNAAPSAITPPAG